MIFSEKRIEALCRYLLPRYRRPAAAARATTPSSQVASNPLANSFWKNGHSKGNEQPWPAKFPFQSIFFRFLPFERGQQFLLSQQATPCQALVGKEFSLIVPSY